MSNLPDICGDGYLDRLEGAPAVDPFRALHVHFGMLMGVDDFETIDAYHRGKMWLHSAWLHREGVAWGLRVSLDGDTGEVRVEPGLAVDGRGRELYLEQAACLDLAQWFAEQREEGELEIEELADGRLGFAAHVVMRFQGCLARQVPALVEPCDNAARTTAYSRLFETVRLELVPNAAPARAAAPYHRLRLLFGIDPPETTEDEVVTEADQQVLTARAAVLAAAPEERAARCLELFRRLAAEDGMDLEPETVAEGESFPLFPAAEPAPVVLADLTGLVMRPQGDGFVLDDDGAAAVVDNAVRPSHVATSTIQELLCGASCCSHEAGEEGAEAAGGDGQPEAADAGGPRGNPESGEVDGRSIRFTVTADILADSLNAAAFSVSALVAGDGWQDLPVAQVTFNRSLGRVSVRLAGDPPDTLLRLVARGTGPAPLLGESNVPFAGSVGGPPGSAHDGHDFALMIDRS